MMIQHLVDATGLAALSLNLGGLARPGDRTLRKTMGWASALWALNDLLIGAPAAAALSALSVGRQASASALQHGPGRWKFAAFAILVALTLLVGAITWDGSVTLFPLAGSLLASYATFYLAGAALRATMVPVSALWMVYAVAVGSWWQIGANAAIGAASAVGAWRALRANRAPRGR